MKKILSVLIVVLLLVATTFVLTGCGNNETDNNGGNSDVNTKKWPVDISYVPNIAYDGAGKIVKVEEDSSIGEKQCKIYVNGATVESANAYLDKLTANGWTKLHMFRDADEHFSKPESGKFFKTGYENADGTINVVLILYGDNDNSKDLKYNFVITFGDMSDY